MPRNATRSIVALAALLVAGLSVGLGARGGSVPDETKFPAASSVAYHLRVVRVTGAAAWRGAALGCGGSCGKPIVLPSEEAWGTPEQLERLARALGGERADAVTGYIVLPDSDGEAHFDATVYPGEPALQLRFSARPVDGNDARHEMQLELSANEAEPPLAEVRLIAAPERTVAIAAPSPIESEWVVLAITVLEPRSAEARAAKGAPIELPAGEITPPVLLEQVAPVYPPQARDERRQGRVILQAVIDVEGAVRAITVLRVPQGSEDFAAAAVEAVQRWRYQPARASDGRAVPVYFTVVVEFQLS